SLDVRRRHLSKQEQAEIIVRLAQAQFEATKVGSDVAAAKLGDGHPVSEAKADEVHTGGRGVVNPVRQAAVAAGKAAGIGESTVKTALRKSEAKKQGKPLPKRDRKVKAKIEPKAAKPEPTLVGIVDDISAACDALDIATLDKHPYAPRNQALGDLKEIRALL